MNRGTEVGALSMLSSYLLDGSEVCDGAVCDTLAQRIVGALQAVPEDAPADLRLGALQAALARQCMGAPQAEGNSTICPTWQAQLDTEGSRGLTWPARVVSQHLCDMGPALWIATLLLMLAAVQSEWLSGVRGPKASLPNLQYCLRPEFHLFTGTIVTTFKSLQQIYRAQKASTRNAVSAALLGSLAFFGIGGYVASSGLLQQLGLYTFLEDLLAGLLLLPWNLLQTALLLVGALGVAPLLQGHTSLLSLLAVYVLTLGGLTAAALMLPRMRSFLAPSLGRLLAILHRVASPILNRCSPAAIQASWKNKLVLITVCMTFYTLTHMELDTTAVNPFPEFLVPTLARALAIWSLLCGAAFVTLLLHLMALPSSSSYADFAVLLYTPLLLLTTGSLRFAADIARSPHASYSQVPDGLFWELLGSSTSLAFAAGHMFLAAKHEWPAPSRPLSQQDVRHKLERYQAAMKAGQPTPQIGADDLPEGMGTQYLLLGCAGYVALCALFMPHRAVYCLGLLAAGLSAAHVVV